MCARKITHRLGLPPEQKRTYVADPSLPPQSRRTVGLGSDEAGVGEEFFSK